MDWPQFRGRRVILTHLSRVSIVLAYRMLGLSAGDEILVPSYNCGSEIDPLLWCGAKPIFYRVDLRAKIDPEDIQLRVTPSTRAIFVIHYFGWPQSLKELAKWCKERNIFLIEDCALSLFSEGPEGPVGTIGDAAIHCFWKTFPVPDGGALTMPKCNVDVAEPMRSPYWRAILRCTFPFMKSWLRNQGKKYLGSFFFKITNFYRMRQNKISASSNKNGESALREISSDAYFDEKIKNRSISRLSLGLINQADPDRIVQIRRRNYKKLYEMICDLPGLQPLFEELPDGVCPLVMPVLVSNPREWQIALAKKDVLPLWWWKGYHRNLSCEGFPETRNLKNHLLAFHVDQYLDESKMEYIGSCVREVALKFKKKPFMI